jgi:hypothetical protein
MRSEASAADPSLESEERERAGDEVHDRARCGDAAAREISHRIPAALEVNGRQHERVSAEGDAGTAMAKRFVEDI